MAWSGNHIPNRIAWRPLITPSILAVCVMKLFDRRPFAQLSVTHTTHLKATYVTVLISILRRRVLESPAWRSRLLQPLCCFFRTNLIRSYFHVFTVYKSRFHNMHMHYLKKHVFFKSKQTMLCASAEFVAPQFIFFILHMISLLLTAALLYCPNVSLLNKEGLSFINYIILF